MITTEFGDAIATRMRDEHRMLAARWFERLLDILPVDERDIFPTNSLLDHVPSLILEISNYLRQPEGEAIASNTVIIDKAGESERFDTNSRPRCTRSCANIRFLAMCW